MTEARSAHVGPRQNVVAALVVTGPTKITVAADVMVAVRVESTAAKERLFSFTTRAPWTGVVYEDVRILAYPETGRTARVSVWAERVRATA